MISTKSRVLVSTELLTKLAIRPVVKLGAEISSPSPVVKLSAEIIMILPVVVFASISRQFAVALVESITMPLPAVCILRAVPVES